MDKEEIQEVFTRNLKAFMARDNINQTELAHALGASVGQVNAWVHGNHVPRTNHLATMTALFGCQVSDLLTDKSKDPPQCDGPPEKYDRLNPANRAIVDTLIDQLLKAQSENLQGAGSQASERHKPR